VIKELKLWKGVRLRTEHTAKILMRAAGGKSESDKEMSGQDTDKSNSWQGLVIERQVAKILMIRSGGKSIR
jgi:hypothetical protein